MAEVRLQVTDAVELVLLTDAADTSLLLCDSSAVTDLRQMAALLDGLRALGSGRVVDEVLTLVTDLGSGSSFGSALPRTER